jgi:hypothetical protein
MARATLPQFQDVARGDTVQGGVALLANSREVAVHPYIFRLICKNGAVMPQFLQSHRIVCSEYGNQFETCESIRQAVQECCEPDVFVGNARHMELSRHSGAELLVQMLPLLTQMSREYGLQLVSLISRRFLSLGDTSRFGLMNAVTSQARDTRNQMLRWRLEELGGGLALGILPRLPNPAGVALALPVA